jgi:AraC-like DNA-binding protein/mannose-6-phosphate isomerase-like protein (cupin superfamily)
MSLAGSPRDLIKNPKGAADARPADDDVLSNVLRTVRLSGSLQFCFMPTGSWETEGKGALSNLADHPSIAVPFHIVVAGSCWLRMEGQQIALEAGDVLAFPFGTPHKLGAGADGRLLAPVSDLPPKPWREVPVLSYGRDRGRVRLLCGYLQCDAMRFRPLREALPALIHVRTAGSSDAAWLRATIGQMAREVDRPQTGGLSMLERLTEITFIELLRHQVIASGRGSVGWLAALADPSLARCLSLIHDDPRRAWSVPDLAAASALSRSSLTERFETVLNTSPMRYVRDWRLCLASMALTTTGRTIAAIAHDAGYGTEAAFSRAFSRTFGAPPAAWRQNAGRMVQRGL